MKRNKLISLSKKSHRNFQLLEYFRRIAQDTTLINDLIVYDGERNILSICNSIELIDEAIRLGADIYKPAFSSENTSWLNYLCRRHTYPLKIILHVLETYEVDINFSDHKGDTLLHYALDRDFRRCQHPNIELAKYLIKRGANICALNNEFDTALKFIDSSERVEFYEKLKNYDAR